jgi:hypothetical protein
MDASVADTGQVAGRIEDIPPAADIINQMWTGCREALAATADRIGRWLGLARTGLDVELDPFAVDFCDAHVRGVGRAFRAGEVTVELPAYLHFHSGRTAHIRRMKARLARDDVNDRLCCSPRFDSRTWIKMRPDRRLLDADAVRAFCSGKLAHYKIPRYVHIVDEFPTTATGKVRKVDMRAETIRLLGL